MKNLGKLTQLYQTDFDDDVQTLLITFEDGTEVQQKREWPTLTFREDDITMSLHETLTNNELYVEAVMHAPELMYGMIAEVTKLIDGQDLDMETVGLEEFDHKDVQITDHEVLHEHWFKVIRLACNHTLFSGGKSDDKEHTFVKGRAGVCVVIYVPDIDHVVAIVEERGGCGV